MKRTIIAVILLTNLLTLVLAQSANPKGDLITALRQDAGNMFTAIQSFRGHRAEYVSKNINFVDGDLTGANSTGQFVGNDVDQMVVDMKTICDAIENGGTINVGVWGNVIKIK